MEYFGFGYHYLALMKFQQIMEPTHRLSWSFSDQEGGNEVDWHSLWMGKVEFDMSRSNDVYTNMRTPQIFSSS